MGLCIYVTAVVQDTLVTDVKPVGYTLHSLYIA